MERDKTTKIIGGILAVLMFFALGFGLYYLVTHWDTIFGSTTEQPTEPEEPVEKVEISDWVFNGKVVAQYKGTDTEITNIPISYSFEEKVVNTIECATSEDVLAYVFSYSEEIESPILFQTNLVRVTYNSFDFSKTYDNVGSFVVDIEGLLGEYGEDIYNLTIDELETTFYEGSDYVVDTLGGTAFYGQSVISIDIPSNITKLDGFVEPESLEFVTLRSDTVVENTAEYLGFFTRDCKIYVPENLLEEYKITYSSLASRIYPIGFVRKEITGYTLAGNTVGVMTASVANIPKTYSREDTVIYSKAVSTGLTTGTSTLNSLFQSYQDNDLDGYQVKGVPVRVSFEFGEPEYFASLYDFLSDYAIGIVSGLSCTIELLESTYYEGSDYSIDTIALSCFYDKAVPVWNLPKHINKIADPKLFLDAEAFSKLKCIFFSSDTAVQLPSCLENCEFFVFEDILAESQILNSTIAGHIYSITGGGEQTKPLPNFEETDVNDFIFSFEDNSIVGYYGASDSIVIPTSYSIEFREDVRVPYPGNNEISREEIVNYVNKRLDAGKTGIFFKEDGSQLEIPSVFQVTLQYNQIIQCVARLEDKDVLVNDGENILSLSTLTSNVPLKSITIDSSMELLNSNFLENIDSLEELVIYGDELLMGISPDFSETCKIYVKANLVNAYKQLLPSHAANIFAIEV